MDGDRPVFLKPVAVVTPIRRPADTAKHFGLARTCQRILRNEAPRAGFARLVSKPLAQEGPTGPARKVGSLIGRAQSYPLDCSRSNPSLVIHGTHLKLGVRVHAVEEYETESVLAFFFGGRLVCVKLNG